MKKEQIAKTTSVLTSQGEIIITEDIFGNITRHDSKNIIKNMLIPVQCNHCGKVYDLCDGKVIHRYMDCTMYHTPCCNVIADDREWKTFADFTRIEKS